MERRTNSTSGEFICSGIHLFIPLLASNQLVVAAFETIYVNRIQTRRTTTIFKDQRGASRPQESSNLGKSYNSIYIYVMIFLAIAKFLRRSSNLPSHTQLSLQVQALCIRIFFIQKASCQRTKTSGNDFGNSKTYSIVVSNLLKLSRVPSLPFLLFLHIGMAPTPK